MSKRYFGPAPDALPNHTGAALIHFLRQRARFYKYLSDTTPSLRKADYIRLLLLTFVQMIGGVTVTSILLWYDYFVAETRPWKSWANVHSNWGRIAQFPKALFEPQAKRFVYGLSWNVQVSCLCVFIFFTSVSDVVRQCKAAYAWFNLVVLRRRLPEPPAKVRM